MRSASQSEHSFHITVLGTGFTIDTPLYVAKYGISSVISIMDDALIEQIRKFHAAKAGEPYEAIPSHHRDSRARRITLYLNLVNRLVQRQVLVLQASPFAPGSEITRYFEMLPDTSLKRAYTEMVGESDSAKKSRMQQDLRRRARPGSIDVNIMTKVDRDTYREGEKLPPEYALAMAALRGYAVSDLQSSIIFSAGTNPRLYTYLTRFTDFLPDENGRLRKKVVLKVSDYRSAEVQGKFLAKRGIWVSEYRIESGLNCGGHAFATKGVLMGPALEEFKQKKQELIEKLFAIYTKALMAGGYIRIDTPLDVRVTVQGGIGTAAENGLLLKYYNVDRTGWGTPFLLVPEVTNVDTAHLNRLMAATEQDVYLSDSSPLGIPFWNLRTSESENVRRRRIDQGQPGSRCPKGYLATDTELTETPLCHASRAFQERKLKNLLNENYSEKQLSTLRAGVMGKSCLCQDLAGGAILKKGINPDATPAICCGPNIVNFSKIATLEDMVNHIYGRISLLTRSDRPHMFIRELMLYLDYLRKEVEKWVLNLSTRVPEYFSEFTKNLFSGIEYYRHFAKRLRKEEQERFLGDLAVLFAAIEPILLDPTGRMYFREPYKSVTVKI